MRPRHGHGAAPGRKIFLITVSVYAMLNIGNTDGAIERVTALNKEIREGSVAMIENLGRVLWTYNFSRVFSMCRAWRILTVPPTFM